MKNKNLRKFKSSYQEEILHDHYNFYKKLGVDFYSCYKLDKINCIDYEPTLRSTFIESMQNIKLDDELIFCDCGSGLGHVMYLASGYFKYIIGVEIDNELLELSKKNLELTMPSNVRYEIYNCDIQDVRVNKKSQISFDYVNVYYLFNPFVGNIFQKFINNIIDSININDRYVCIIYVNPICAEIMDKYDNLFSLKASYFNKITTNLYEHHPILSN